MARKTKTSSSRGAKPPAKPAASATRVRAMPATSKLQPLDHKPAVTAGLEPFVCKGLAELRRRTSGRTADAVGDALTRLEADFRRLLGTG